MAYIQTDKNKIYYATNRKSWKTESGLQLVFIHGAGGDHRTWIFQIEHFRKHYNFYALDLPGHAFSKGERCADIEEYAHFIGNFIITLGLKESILIGHSMGGAIAQISALKYASHIKGIVLIGTGARLKVSPLFLEKFMQINPETADFFCTCAFAKTADSDIISKAKEMILGTSPDAFYHDFVACNNFDMMNDVKNISLPTLIIGAAKDQMTPLKYSQYLHEHISSSELVIVENAGHMIMLENPIQVNKAIDRWLAGIRSHTSGSLG